MAVAALASLSLVLPLSAGADDNKSSATAKTYIAPAVYQAAKNDPRGKISVIIMSVDGANKAENAFKDSEKVVEDAEKAAEDATKAEEQAAAEEQKVSEEARKASAEATAASAKASRADRKARQAAQREAERAAREAERAAARARSAEDARSRASERARAKRDESSKWGSRRLSKLAARLKLVDGVTVEMPANWVYLLERIPGLTVTLDAPVKATSFSSTQLWPYQNGASAYWGSLTNPGPKPPAIAIVDSGIERGVIGFGVAGSRIVHREQITTLAQDNSKQDGRGHGTFVAALAAGDAPLYTGVAPRADLVDLDVMNDQGMARTSDVIKAAEWILAHKEQHNIRVANFSLHSSSVLSIKHHPLNRAVEQLWFNGVVVVAAAGNYGTPNGPSGVVHAPGNDPFVITVGAYDLEGTSRIWHHDVPTWSAYGYTNEGFAKPDVVAAGRYIVAPAPLGNTMGLEKPERILSGGALRLSGTSFAAPIVSGMAAQILARKPNWTPDQVKGALMMGGRRMPDASILEQGRGEVNLVRSLGYSNPANPNSSLNAFVVDDPNGGGKVFDTTAFYNAVVGDRTWDSAAWQDAAWQSAAWQDAAWQDAAWQDAAWQDAAWQDAAWQDSTSYEDNVQGEPDGAEALLTPEEAEALANDPELHSEETP